MAGHAWVTLAHCVGIYYWRHRLGYTHCVGTLLYILLAHYVRVIPTHNVPQCTTMYHNVPQCTTMCACNTHAQCTHWVFITRHRCLRLNIARVPTIIASSLSLLYMGKEGPMPWALNKKSIKYFLREDIPKKKMLFFWILSKSGGEPCPNFLSPFHKCIFGQ